MPRQGWETNKAGGKGPAVARESDKWLLQPGCPVHPHVETGPQTVQIHAGLSLVGRTEPSPCCAARFEHCCAALLCPIGAGGAASSEHQLCPGCPRCQAASGCVGRARRHTGGAAQGRPGWQADGWQLRFNSASLFSQTNPVGFS